MRTLLFRGKREDNGEWIIGYFAEVNGIGAAIYDAIKSKFVPIEPSTLGQDTGLMTRYSLLGTWKWVFEGDIVQLYDADNKYRYIVYWYEEQARFAGRCIETGSGIADLTKYNVYKVLGNIHDNPELVNPAAKGGEQ